MILESNIAGPAGTHGTKTRVLVLGATGMLGHKMAQSLPAHGLSVFATIRTIAAPDTLAARTAFSKVDKILTNVDVLNDDALANAFETSKPDVVINAVGLIKQLDASKDPIPSIQVNSLLPHRLAKLCASRGARLIHFSTDCVFSGRKGPYREDSPTDASDLYGRSKLLGEVGDDCALTIRSSIIGRELRGRSGLVEWFLAQRGSSATGFTGALYTGLTTNEMSNLVGRLITHHPDLSGIWNVASESISKYELLALVNRHFGSQIELSLDDKFVIDRRLDGTRFRERTGYVAPSWEGMIAEMKADCTRYDATGE